MTQELRVGVHGIGLHIPRYRLSRKTIAAAWKRDGGAGEKAVAGHDEDSLTMAAEAGLACLESPGAAFSIHAVFFSSSTPPLYEQSCAALLASFLGADGCSQTLDLVAIRAMTNGIALGAQGVRAGTWPQVLVAGGERRTAEPGSEMEPILGDGGGALLLGEAGGYADLIGIHITCRPFTATWRLPDEPFTRTADPQYVQNYGFTAEVSRGLEGALKEWALTPEEVSRVAISGPSHRAAEQAARQAGFSTQQLLPGLQDRLGYLGTVHPLPLLAALLDGARPADRLILAAYGDGADCLLFRATDRVGEMQGVVDRSVQVQKPLADYLQFLRFRQLVPEAGELKPFTSLTEQERERAFIQGLRARECPACGTIITLDLRVCPHCEHRGEFREKRLARRGTVFSFTHEHYFPTPDPPLTMAVVALEGGGRLTVQMADTDPDAVRVGAPVVLVPRKLHQAASYPHYAWKAKLC